MLDTELALQSAVQPKPCKPNQKEFVLLHNIQHEILILTTRCHSSLTTQEQMGTTSVKKTA
eukprot:scaffold212104_cov132-Cyclotella_meneghiniana.AAC.1